MQNRGDKMKEQLAVKVILDPAGIPCRSWLHQEGKGGKKLSIYLAFFLVNNFSVKNAAVTATIKKAGSSPILLPIVCKS